jgi:hypothetical protein
MPCLPPLRFEVVEAAQISYMSRAQLQDEPMSLTSIACHSMNWERSEHPRFFSRTITGESLRCWQGLLSSKHQTEITNALGDTAEQELGREAPAGFRDVRRARFAAHLWPAPARGGASFERPSGPSGASLDAGDDGLQCGGACEPAQGSESGEKVPQKSRNDDAATDGAKKKTRK